MNHMNPEVESVFEEVRLSFSGAETVRLVVVVVVVVVVVTVVIVVFLKGL